MKHMNGNTAHDNRYCSCGRRGRKRTVRFGDLIDPEPGEGKVVERLMCDECAKASGILGGRFCKVDP
jgi:hypothetical protein